MSLPVGGSCSPRCLSRQMEVPGFGRVAGGVGDGVSCQCQQPVPFFLLYLHAMSDGCVLRRTERLRHCHPMEEGSQSFILVIDRAVVLCRYNTLPSRRTLKNSRLVSKKDDVHVCIMCLRAIMNYQVFPFLFSWTTSLFCCREGEGRGQW